MATLADNSEDLVENVMVPHCTAMVQKASNIKPISKATEDWYTGFDVLVALRWNKVYMT